MEAVEKELVNELWQYLCKHGPQNFAVLSNPSSKISNFVHEFPKWSELVGVGKQLGKGTEVLARHRDLFEYDSSRQVVSSLRETAKTGVKRKCSLENKEEKRCRSLKIAPTHTQLQWKIEVQGSYFRDGGELLDFFIEHEYEINALVLAEICERFKRDTYMFDTIKSSDSRLMRLLFACAERAQEFSRFELVRVLRAHLKIGQKLGLKSDQLYQALAQAALHKAHEFSSSDISKMSIAFAWARTKLDPKLLRVFAETTLERIAHLQVEFVLDAIVAFVELGVQSSELFTEFYHIYIKDNFNDKFHLKQQINILWIFATVELDPSFNDTLLSLFKKFANSAISTIHRLDPPSLVRLAFSLAKASIHAHTLVGPIADSAVIKIAYLSTQQYILLAWSLATLGINHKPFFHDALANALLSASLAQDVHIQNEYLVHGLWSLSVAQCPTQEVFDALLTILIPKIMHSYCTELALLHLVLIYYHLTFTSDSCPLETHAHDLQSAYFKMQPLPSKLQRDVSEVLSQLDRPHVFDYTIPQGLSIDIAQPAEKFALLVDPSSHHLSSTSSSPRRNGDTIFKARLLTSLGWTIVHVPFFEWETHSNKQAYLYDKLPR